MSRARAARTAASTSVGCRIAVTSSRQPPVCRLAVRRTANLHTGGTLEDVTERLHPVLADAAQVAGMLAHWQEALTAIGFLDPAMPKKLMPRLQQMFHRTQLRQEEIHILRGIAKAMLQTRAGKPLD